MTIGNALLNWYKDNARELPWRESADPYPIWISEIMLQQTTVKAVIPFFERFMGRFPDVDSLAEAEIEDIYEYWAGLGYYSRARNIHKAAKVLTETGFPNTHEELIELPGFGPYVSRAVSSFAFDENVGVLDGNVIRFLSRLHDLEVPWWTTKGRRVLQDKADELVHGHSAQILNQALIEMGATICTPKKPACLVCPVQPECLAYPAGTVEQRPSKKPRKATELWQWTPHLHRKNGRIKMVTNDYAPFLKGQSILPGQAKAIQEAPTKYDFVHHIMNFKIFVQLKKRQTDGPEGRWLFRKQILRESPSSLIDKTLKILD